MNSLTEPVAADDLDLADPDESQDFSYALNPDVHVSLRRDGPALLVCFGSAEPFEDVVDEMGWSILHLDAKAPGALHGEQVVGFFDAMVDGTLLDEFDRVLFLGADAFAGAALGYSVCAPLSRALVFAPRGTLPSPDRYAPSAATLSAADKVHVIYDPMDTASAASAREISERGADLLPMRFGDSADVIADLARLDVMDTVLEDAMDRQLSRMSFFRTLRARRNRNPYLRRLNARLIEADRKLLQALTLRHIGTKLGRRRYLQEYEKLSAELAQNGVTVPDARA